jgi:hypothetical protein
MKNGLDLWALRAEHPPVWHFPYKKQRYMNGECPVWGW